MRLRIIKVMTGEIDGIALSRFRIGHTYDVGTAVGSYLLALRAAVPVIPEPTAHADPRDPPNRRDRRGTKRHPPGKIR